MTTYDAIQEPDFNLHENVDVDWNQFTYFCGDGKNKMNNKCKIDSLYCSIEDSDVEGLCLWHRIRMAKHKNIDCGCKQNIVCVGDSIGRNIFRQFYNNWNIPVIDSLDMLYCCGESQNSDTFIASCGTMLVCPKHIHKHNNIKYPDHHINEDEYEVSESSD